MSEVWKQSRFYSGYEVSSLGRVRRKDRMVAQSACGRAARVASERRPKAANQQQQGRQKTMNHDEINNPAHYQLFPDVEAIDVIKAALTPAEFIGYLKGSALKYRLRAGDKGPAEKCIGKSRWYQNYLRSEHESRKPDRADLGDFGQQNILQTIDCDSRTITEWPADDSRIDAIGRNGNDGFHYQSNDGA